MQDFVLTIFNAGLYQTSNVVKYETSLPSFHYAKYHQDFSTNEI